MVRITKQDNASHGVVPPGIIFELVGIIITLFDTKTIRNLLKKAL